MAFRYLRVVPKPLPFGAKSGRWINRRCQRAFVANVKVYTKTGDNGTSMLFNLERRPKTDRHFTALGDTDELNASLGVVREHVQVAAGTHPELLPLSATLIEVQSRLFDVGSHLATPLSSSDEKRLARAAFAEDHTRDLEHAIDQLDSTLPPITNFVLPSGGLLSCHLHVARTICRRAERSTVALVADGEVDIGAQHYLNRLSDYLFVAARFASQAQGQEEILYKKAKESKKAT